ncbi:MAG: biotin transporter BioY [Eggerthellaceae bacterium]|jgi:biotin transport system substrate-specific component
MKKTAAGDTQAAQPMKPLLDTTSRARSLAFIALAVALIAVSAWVTIPIGPIPLTLQMFAITLAILVLAPKQAIAAIACYLLLGAIGVPVFSGMRGGIGVLAGPTGGFLIGYLFGVALASVVLALFRRRGFDNLAVSILSGVIFTLVAYLCGWAQYMVVAHVGAAASFAVTVAPFIVVDLVKIVAAAFVARAVVRAVPQRR